MHRPPCSHAEAPSGVSGRVTPNFLPPPRLHAPALRLPASPAPGSSGCGKLVGRGRPGPLPQRTRWGAGGPGGNVHGGGHGPAPGPPSGGAGAASVLGGRAGRPVANGAGTRGREEDSAGGSVSRVPGADVASSEASSPACCASGGPRPSAALTCRVCLGKGTGNSRGLTRSLCVCALNQSL